MIKELNVELEKANLLLDRLAGRNFIDSDEFDSETKKINQEMEMNYHPKNQARL